MKKSKRLARALAHSLSRVAILALGCGSAAGALYSVIHHPLELAIGLLITFIGILTYIKYKELD